MRQLRLPTYLVVFVALGALFLVTTLSPVQAHEPENEDLFLGISTKVVQNVWEGIFQESFRWYAEDHGWKYNAMQARGNPTLQNTHIRRLVNMGVDGLIVSASDADVSVSAVEYAVDNGVPVITTDADVNSEKVTMYVGYSGVRASRLLAKKTVKYLKNEVEPIGKAEGTVLELRGPMGGASANDRHRGFAEEMKNHPGVTVETVVGEFRRGPAKSAALPKIRARDYDAMYAGNGPMIMGGISAMEAVGKRIEDKFITTIDAMPAVIDAINKDKVDLAFDQPAPFYNPIALTYLDKYIAHGESALPEPGETIEAGELGIDPAKHSGITWWKNSTWAPAKITTREGHLWFQTSGILVDKSNANMDSLWANADMPGW